MKTWPVFLGFPEMLQSALKAQVEGGFPGFCCKSSTVVLLQWNGSPRLFLLVMECSEDLHMIAFMLITQAELLLQSGGQREQSHWHVNPGRPPLDGCWPPTNRWLVSANLLEENLKSSCGAKIDAEENEWNRRKCIGAQRLAGPSWVWEWLRRERGHICSLGHVALSVRRKPSCGHWVRGTGPYMSSPWRKEQFNVANLFFYYGKRFFSFNIFGILKEFLHICSASNEIFIVSLSSWV